MKQSPNSEWNSTTAEFPKHLLIHNLFEQQASKTPDAIALIDGPKKYTYQQINEHANQLARVLTKRGVGNESIVGCFFTRSSAIVFYTLAIMKAGGTYVLLDHTMPVNRLRHILSDARPVLVITDTLLPGSVATNNLNCQRTSELEQASASEITENLSNSLLSSSAAYIAYTSGSTGRPKGVIITHRATVNHAYAFSRLFHLAPSDRVPLMAPIAFDMAIEEMVPPLVSGCTLIVSSSQFASMQDFHEEVQRNRYSLLNIPAPLWNSWTDYLIAEKLSIPPNLRLVITGSDKLHTKRYLQWKQLPGADTVEWVAAYGTTETTVTSTFYATAATDELTGEPYIPIGKPIANTQLYILDEQLNPVAIGEEGQLYIAGEGLARGYLNLEDTTRRKFIANPFSSRPEDRMYCTGDKARYRPDGQVIWLGRADAQVKLYGLRIEPGEIETALNRASGVKESVVVLQQHGDQESDKQLVAFLLAENGSLVAQDELLQIANDYLPKHMIPHQFVTLRTWPLNSNGKIDRKGLEQLDTSREHQHEYA
jgi:amino acid adenylation domain-containing protein